MGKSKKKVAKHSKEVLANEIIPYSIIVDKRKESPRDEYEEMDEITFQNEMIIVKDLKFEK